MGGFDVGNDQIQSLRGAGRGRRNVLAEDDGGRRARRRELDPPIVVGAGEIGIQPPAETGVKLLGAFDVGDGDDDDFEPGVDGGRLRGRGGVRSFTAWVMAYSFPVGERLACRESSGAREGAKRRQARDILPRRE